MIRMKSTPEINALEHRIKELEDAIVHYKAREEQVEVMLQRIIVIAEEEAITEHLRFGGETRCP